MISPSNIVGRILADPEVPETIKVMVGDGSDVANVRQAVEILAQVIPRYKDMIDGVPADPYLTSQSYQSEFQEFDIANLLAREKSRIQNDPIIKMLRRKLIKGDERLDMPRVSAVEYRVEPRFDDKLKKIFPNYESLAKKDIVIAELDYVVPKEYKGKFFGSDESLGASHRHAIELVQKYNVNLPGIENYNQLRIDPIKGLPIAIGVSDQYQLRNGDGGFTIVILFSKSRPLMSV